MRSIYFYTGPFAHTFYRHQFACPPPDFEFIAANADLVGRGIKSDIPAMGTLRGKVVESSKLAAVRAFELARIPNARRLSADADLIHSAQHLLLTRTPWVVDFEDVSVFFWYRRALARSSRAQHRVERLLESDRCRRILPWTRAALTSLENCLENSAIRAKSEVVYPAISLDRVPRPRPATNNGKVRRLLFVGTRFYTKGGLETLRVFKRLRRSHNVELTMVTILPEEMRTEAASVPGLTILSKVDPARLEMEYENADVFVLPVHTDTFGFVFLEAFAHGIPCVGTRHFAVPEIISDGESGLIAPAENSYFGPDFLPQHSPVVDEGHPLVSRIREPSESYLRGLEEALGALIENDALRADLGTAAFDSVNTGRFSCGSRRSVLNTVYGEALTGNDRSDR